MHTEHLSQLSYDNIIITYGTINNKNIQIATTPASPVLVIHSLLKCSQYAVAAFQHHACPCHSLKFPTNINTNKLPTNIAIQNITYTVQIKKTDPTTEFTGFLLANAYFTAIFQFLLRIRVETYMYTQNVFNIFSCFQILCHYTMSQ